jgi:hypothetical protein
MPSLETIANEVKAIVHDIHDDTTPIKNNTNAIKNDIGVMKTDIEAGFTNLAQGLHVLINIGIVELQLINENNKQNETIICWLTNIANTLCDIKHNTDKEVKLQKDLSKTLHHMDDIGELVNSREAMEVANRAELEARIDKCCPEEEEPPRPCFEKCPSPKPTRVEPPKVDWKPVQFDKERHPNG